MSRIDPEVRENAHPPKDDLPPDRNAWIPVAIAVVVVLGSTSVFLVTGHDLFDAMLGGSGMALVGNQAARRIIADGGPLPSVIVGAAVTVFAAILIAKGYDLPKALMGAGVAGLLAGEVAGRMLGTAPQLRRGV
ncbi:hypothetical protein [Virgisporangium aurantiacum]|uniref:Uncharacterized protein n=1 Tax=Virgisporangium aurantiacum TaxID=175570 RepID=A0A8J3Z6U6_9ACTN|nr:hypothetical protein [Virgisporangium aurantiacum]GIJ58052.1 hypothetical protein Vau01_055680 [Virgisporangium aurantiacum]